MQLQGDDLPRHGARRTLMQALESDYDDDPGRWASHDFSTQKFGDVHEGVAERIRVENLAPVLDVGGGDGRLELHVPGIIVDTSPTQLSRAPHPKVRADALQLPFPDNCAGAVTMLWMLYHLDNPHAAIVEARRVLKPGGLFVACAPSRFNEPELTDGNEPTPFDSEDAPAIVASVFGDVEVDAWDAPMTYLETREQVLQRCRAHQLPATAADRVTAPVWITQRGCLVYAYKRAA